MSSKIKYRIVNCSSFEAGYPPSELEVQGNNTKGWQSSRFCEFPQEIVLAFDRVYEISQVQILSHQAKIATKIEIFPGVALHGGVVADYRDAEFKRLGYLSLDPNERSNWKARELKSVFVEARAQFIKFSIFKNHINAINLFNQVGVVAINVLGAAVPAQLPTPAQAAVDDIAIDMQLDAVTAAQIRQLHAEKVKAVQAENYEEAKRLKQTIESLTAVGSQIAKLEAKKQQAVATEDYDEAKKIKDQIDRLRGQYAPKPPAPKMEAPKSRLPYQQQPQPAYEDEYDDAPMKNIPVPSQPQRSALKGGSSNQSRQPSYRQQQPAQPEYDDYAQPSIPSSVASNRNPYQPVGRGVLISPPEPEYDDEEPPQNQYDEDEYPPESRTSSAARREDRPLPALAKKQQQQHSEHDDDDTTGSATASGAASGGEDDEGPPPLGEPEPLSAVDEKDASPLIDLFGERCVRGLYSKVWNHREHAIKAVANELQRCADQPDIGPRTLYRVLIPLLKRLLNDKVPQVFLGAVGVFERLTVDYCGDQKKDEVQRQVEGLLPVLVKRLDDANARVRAAALKTCLALSAPRHAVGAAAIGSHLLKPLKANAAPTQHEQRAAYLLPLLPTVGVSAKADAQGATVGFPLDAVMQFIVLSLQHKAGNVREDGVRLAAQVYAHIGKRINPFLEQLKPAMIDLLNQAFESTGQPSSLHTHHAEPPAPAQAKSSGAAKKSGGAAPADKSKKDVKSPTKKTGDKKKAAPEPAPELPQLSGPCQFCDLDSPEFTDESKLDQHFWQACPMLSLCQYCQQVVEIPMLVEHLTVECEQAPQVKHVECPTCKLAVVGAQLEQHQSNSQECRPRQSNVLRCPLCREDLPSGGDAWKTHLLQNGGCKANPRKPQ